MIPEYGTAQIKCAKHQCSWTGLETDRFKIVSDTRPAVTTMHCPKCGSKRYYFVEETK